jgi:hypothetical protein
MKLINLHIACTFIKELGYRRMQRTLKTCFLTVTASDANSTIPGPSSAHPRPLYCIETVTADDSGAEDSNVTPGEKKTEPIKMETKIGMSMRSVLNQNINIYYDSESNNFLLYFVPNKYS